MERIAKSHSRWLNESDGWSDTDQAIYYDCDFRGAKLKDTSLSMSLFTGCDFRNATFINVDFSCSDLSGSRFDGAVLDGCNFCDANLTDVSMKDVSARNTYFADCNLTQVDFTGADLYGSSLYGSTVYEDALKNAENYTPCFTAVPDRCPSKDSFVCWKKVRKGLIVKMLIPNNANRINIDEKRCKTDRAYVLGIEHIDGSKADVEKVESLHKSNFFYKIGEELFQPGFKMDTSMSAGLYFFMDRKEAVNY